MRLVIPRLVQQLTRPDRSVEPLLHEADLTREFERIEIGSGNRFEIESWWNDRRRDLGCVEHDLLALGDSFDLYCATNERR